MEKEVNSKRNKPPLNTNRLNTKGCCFLCLQIVNFKAEGENETRTKPAVSLRCVRRHLKIELPTASTVYQRSQDNTEDIPQKQKEIEADLCKSCEEIVRQFSTSFLSLEKFQMEVNYWLKRIHQQIRDGSKKPEIVQIYSKRMTSDPETLTQLVLVDNFRKEIAKKSFEVQKRFDIAPNVEIVPLQNIEKYLVKPQQQAQSQWNDTDFESEEDFYSDNEMTPSSPLRNIKEEAKRETAIPATPRKFKNGDETLPFPSWSTSPSTANAAINELPQISNVQSNKKMMYNKNFKMGTFDCIRCQKKFISVAGAREHYKSVHLGKRFKCDICGGSYSTKQFMKKHKSKCDGSARQIVAKRGTKSVLNPSTKKFTCVKCKREFAHLQSAHSHYDSVHLNRRYKCDVCKKDFKQKCTFYTHRKTCKDLMISRLGKQLAKETNPNYKFPCKVCGIKFKSKGNMSKHYKSVHLKERNYGCDHLHCKKRFGSHAELTVHKTCAHSGKGFYCGFCKRQFTYKNNMQAHEKRCAKKSTIKTDVV